MKKIIYILVLAGIVQACQPYIDPDISIPAAPGAPTVSAVVSADDPNKVIVTAPTEGVFSQVWHCPGGIPSVSEKAVDTILYTLAGDYEITLHVAANGGGGTAEGSTTINIAEDLQIACDSTMAKLTGDCSSVGKQWKFSNAAGAISVGPNPYSSEWYSSPENGLVPEQYDDRYNFFFEGASFVYSNNGLSVDPCNGYQAVPYDPNPNATWVFTPGAGLNGEDRITLPPGSWMGVWDSGPWYDILTLTEDELVLHGPILDCSGNSPGYFTLYFVKAD